VNSGAPGIRQPVNTLFNLYALITAGIVAFVLSRDRAEGGTAIVIRSNSLKADGYVFAVLFLGLGSMWFHASLSATVAWLDGLSMYVYAAFLVFYTVDRWLGRRSASQLLRDLLFWIGWPLVAVGFTLLGAIAIAHRDIGRGLCLVRIRVCEVDPRQDRAHLLDHWRRLDGARHPFLAPVLGWRAVVFPP
jgi:hypothetical protein